jgi:hypothetical protein
VATRKRTPSPTEAQRRFAAMLLFQWRVEVDGGSGSRRTCERRLINLFAPSPKVAIAFAIRAGEKAQFRGRTTRGYPLRFEFIGLSEIMELGEECGPDEVWYDIVAMVRAMERRRTLVLDSRGLAAFRAGQRSWARANALSFSPPPRRSSTKRSASGRRSARR